jgi:hypothetical protein
MELLALRQQSGLLFCPTFLGKLPETSELLSSEAERQEDSLVLLGVFAIGFRLVGDEA